MSDKPFQFSEEDMRLMAYFQTALKTQISLVRNVEGQPFPERLNETAAIQLADQLVKRLQTAFAPGLVTIEDVTGDEELADEGEELYGLAPRTARSKAYRLLRMQMQDEKGTVVWCEVMSANHFTFSLCTDEETLVEQSLFLRRFVDLLDLKFNYAYDPKLGYLTAQLALLGTGFRIRTWLHVGALAYFGYLRELQNMAEVKESLIEGINQNTFEPPPGHIVILFNRDAMGHTVESIAKQHLEVALRIAEEEMAARYRWAHTEPFAFLDTLKRGNAMVRNALMISEAEALDFMSDLRIALYTDVIRSKTLDPTQPLWFTSVRTSYFMRHMGLPLEEELSRPLFPRQIREDATWHADALRATYMRNLYDVKPTKTFQRIALEVNE